ncbi:hypothetical protein CRV08_07505 [Halarcobacter ebronensis]|uniref:Uncharacterized protein n=1 Tax=Halarcobacter ebronensis TaxID=1462615 RepID=A0A4V1LRL9_9BACT|nr:hypothetical protein [Halarcobacter ebronensis]RXJ68658.1 hypothetical protein CRV08_07505 [Halarcobacter ebronensis]
MNNKETKILNGYQYFFKSIFGFIIGYWAIIAILLMIFGENPSYTSVYYIFGLKLSILNDYVVLTSLFLGFLTTLLLAIKQHKKYQSLKAKNGN